MPTSEAKYQQLFNEAQADAIRFRQERDELAAEVRRLRESALGQMIIVNTATQLRKQAETQLAERIIAHDRRVTELLEANNRELERRRVLDSECSQLLAEQKLVRAECIRQRDRAEKLAEFIEELPNIDIPADVAQAMEGMFPDAPEDPVCAFVGMVARMDPAATDAGETLSRLIDEARRIR